MGIAAAPAGETASCQEYRRREFPILLDAGDISTPAAGIDHLAWIPLAAAVIATALFAVQGGFGGGHGHFDRLIWTLGFPGVLMASWAPAPFSSHEVCYSSGGQRFGMHCFGRG